MEVVENKNTIEQRIETALKMREKGYNCAQAVIGAYIDLLNIEYEQAMRCSYGFGGGFASQRELCGAVSGAGMVLGLVFGKGEADLQKKEEVSALIRDFSNRFIMLNGSMICGELLGERAKTPPVKVQSCNTYIVSAIRLLEDYLCNIEH